MSAMEPLSQLIGINITKLSKEENILLETEIFSRICEGLKDYFRLEHKEFFRLMKFTTKMEDNMLEENLVRFIIKDTISTGEYNIMGIAHYADTHEDVIQEVIDGRNTNPSASLLRKIINLHRSVRSHLYHSILKKSLAPVTTNNQQTGEI